MNLESIVFELSVIAVGAAVLGTLFLYAKQPIIIAYITLGVAVGPSGLALITRTDHIEQISHIGVILLLFLIGLNLQPAKLIKLFRKTSLLTLFTSVFFGAILVPLKAAVFRLAFRSTGESTDQRKELGVRLGQSSEFSLLVAFSALSAGVLSDKGAMVIQVTTIVTFIISTYWVVHRYPTPISESPSLRRH